MILDSTTSLGKRLDEVQKRLRSIDPLEKRVTAVEKRLDKLEGKGSAKRTPAKRTTKTASTTTKKSPDRRRRAAGLGNAQAQSARDDLEGRRRRARLLAVELDREWDRRLDRDLRTA